MCSRRSLPRTAHWCQRTTCDASWISPYCNGLFSPKKPSIPSSTDMQRDGISMALLTSYYVSPALNAPGAAVVVPPTGLSISICQQHTLLIHGSSGTASAS